MTLVEVLQIAERLGPSYAWPTVALLAMPVVLFRLGDVITSIGNLRAILSDKGKVAQLAGDVEKLNSSIEKLQKGFGQADATATATQKKIEKTLEQLAAYKAAIEESKFENQKASLEKQDTQGQATAINELTPVDDEAAADSSKSGTGLSIEQMRDQVRRDWEEIKAALQEKFEKLNIDYDARSPAKLGVAVLQLAEHDTRQRQKLSAVDAELAVALAAFIKSINQSASGLTPETFGSFDAAARSFKGRILRMRLSAPVAATELAK
jgi:outer membrane murein-binding lipoprotein Lpp